MDLSEEELLEQLLKQDLEDDDYSSNDDEEKDDRKKEDIGFVYDYEDLPEYACEYCQIYEKECMVQCMSSGCKKWFCNKMEDGFGSHAIIHMVSNRPLPPFACHYRRLTRIEEQNEAQES